MKKGEDYVGVTVNFFCHDGAGNYLFAKRGAGARDENGRWDTGGGGLDFGVTVDENLKKEIQEEYCTTVLDYEFLGYRDVHREHNGKPTHWIALDFKVHVDRSLAKIGEPHKFDEMGWFPLTNPPSPLHSQLPIEFELYKGKL
jgi:8-oxo-dGTP pyrophosphatase MutT (NUDIX family)